MWIMITPPVPSSLMNFLQKCKKYVSDASSCIIEIIFVRSEFLTMIRSLFFSSLSPNNNNNNNKNKNKIQPPKEN